MAARTVLLFFLVYTGQRLTGSTAVTVDLKEDAEFPETSKKTVALLHPVAMETSSSLELFTELKDHIPTTTDKIMTTQGGMFQLNGRDNLDTISRQTEEIPRSESTAKSHPLDTALPPAPGSNSIMSDSKNVLNTGHNLDTRSHDQPGPYLEAGVGVLAERTQDHSKWVAVSQGARSGPHLLQEGPRCRRRRSWLWNQFFVIEEYRGPEPVLIGRLHTDMDRGDGRTKYTLEGEGVGSVFVIDSWTGNIHVTKSLDREEKDQYRLIATAKDSVTGRALEPSSEFIIRVQDINDNPPVFPNEPYLVTVPEMANIGTSIFQVTARDADDPTYGNSARLVYAITQGHEYFSVDSQTGVLRTAVADMDREAQEEYLVVLQAKDMGGHLGGLTGTTTVTVKLSDVNDNPPHFRRSAWSFSISELAAPGVEVGRLTATDPDLGENAQLEFTIVDTDHGDAFNVTGRDREAVITLNKLLDYETRNSYSFSVKVSNPLVDPRYIRKGPFKDLAAVRVMVLNADEPPRFSRARYRLDVSENCPAVCSVGRVSAVDPDTGQSANIRFSIDPQSDPEALFRIASDTGFISTVAELDREREQWHNITVIATQRDNPNLVTRVVVAIETLDQNDNAPELDRQYTTSVCDSSAPGQVVQVLRAIDRDQGGHDTPVHFSIAPESSSALNLTIRNSGDMTASLVLRSSLEPQPGYSPSLLSLYVPVVLRDGASGLANTGTVTVVICPCVRGGMQTEDRGRQRDRGWERHAVCLPLPSASPSLIFSMVTLLALLACVTTVLVVCALSLSLRHQKRDSHAASEEDDVRENIISYDDEGGGEADTAAFDMAALQSMQRAPHMRNTNIWYTQQNPPRARTYSWSRNPRPSLDPQRPGSAPLYGRLCYGLHTLPVLRDYPQGPLEAGLRLAPLDYGTPGFNVARTLVMPNQRASAGINLRRGEAECMADCNPADTNGGSRETCDMQLNQDQQTEPPDTGLTLTNEAAAVTFCDPIECSSQSHTSFSSNQLEGRPGSSQTQISTGATSPTTDELETDSFIPHASERNGSSCIQTAVNAPGNLKGDSYSIVGSLNRGSRVPPTNGTGGSGLYPGGVKLLNTYRLGRNDLSTPSLAVQEGMLGCKQAPESIGPAGSLPLQMEDFLNYRLDQVTFDLSQPPYDSLQTYEFEGRDSRADSLSSLESGGEKEEGGSVVGGMEELNQKFQRLVEIIKEREEEKERKANSTETAAAEGGRNTEATDEAQRHASEDRHQGLRWDF